MAHKILSIAVCRYTYALKENVVLTFAKAQFLEIYYPATQSVQLYILSFSENIDTIFRLALTSRTDKPKVASLNF